LSVVKGLAEYLTEHGHPTSVTDIKNMKHRKGELVQNAFDRTDDVMKFIEVVLERHPEFKWEMMVVSA